MKTKTGVKMGELKVRNNRVTYFLNQGTFKVKYGGNIDIIIVVGQRWNE